MTPAATPLRKGLPVADDLLAIDLGATKIALCRGPVDGVVVERPLPRLGDARRELSALSGLLRSGSAGFRGTPVVVVAPAVRDGVVGSWPNRPYWAGLPLADLFAEALGSDVVLLADGDAAAIADAYAVPGADTGGGEDVCHVSLYLGTGVAGGIARGGRPLRLGPVNPELGHIATRLDGPPCSCGATGCLQAAWTGFGDGTTTATAFAAELARHLRTVSRIFPACVVSLGGRYVDANRRGAEELLAQVRERLPDDDWTPRLRLSTAGAHAPLRGGLFYAACLGGRP
ncbi:ROK family protein [Isoptericola sp. G70]|uniref:ROK family protein n=1 Tax=Isoptericola sp. G70 TaxID=3376633 RepID=UPI003A8038D6